MVRVYRQYSYGAGQSEDVQLALAQIGGLAYLLDCGRIQLNSTVAMQAEPGTISTFVRQQSLKWSQQVNFLSRNIYGRMLKRHDQSDHIDACSLQFDWNSVEVITELLSKDMSLFGQSVLHWHPSLADEVRICHEPNSDFGFTAFDETICHHLADALTSKVRTFVLGLSRGRLAQGTGDGLVRYFSRQVDYLSAALCWTVDNVIVMTAGNLNHHQLLCVRFSEAFGFLYLASAVIKRYRDNGQETSEEPLMEWACRYALFSAQQALDEVLNNLPVRYMGLLLRPVVFPTGRYQKLPDDSLHRKVAAVLQTPGPVRNRLTEDVYQPKDLEAFGTHLETAMELCQESANIEQRLDRIGLMPEPGRRWEQWFQERVDASDISRSEADLLQRTRQAVLRVFNIGDRASNEGPDGGQ